MTDAVRFGPFRLDRANAQLFRGTRKVVLRPKTYAILQHLSERPGRLVTKDELLDAVWPDTEVSDGVLKVCMVELRKALGDSAQQPRFVETVHRRGYRFIAKTSEGGSDQLSVISTRGPSSGSVSEHSSLVTDHWSLLTDHLCIGRDAELAALQSTLERSLSGRRQIVFITGEAGIGKTTLLNAFLDAALSTHGSGLFLARGQCVEHYGPAEAYLPILEGLGRLCRQAGGPRLVALLREHAPSWLMQLPGLLSAADREALQRQYAGVSRIRMLRELVVGLEALTADTPMVMTLDDLQWSDSATLDLLTGLARRGEPARLLVVGTFRPVDAQLSGQPLPATVEQLKLRRQCVELVLDRLPAATVGTYLSMRFPGLVAPPPLVSLIHDSTNGNPLFMVNVAEHLVTQRLIVPADNGWRLQAELGAVAREVPKSLRQMIDSQLDALDPASLHLLEAASVAGVEFAAQSVAAALDCPTAAVEEQCSVLVRRRLLQPVGAAEWPDGTVAARYAFGHALVQETLYQRLTPARCTSLHWRVAERLERGLGAQASESAAELAMHFERGRDTRRAIAYYHQAATSAVQRHAYQEAITQLGKALDLLETLPASPERDQRELELRVALGVPQLNTKGFAAPDVARTYARALELCRGLGETPHLFSVLEGLHSFYAVRGELRTAYDLAQQLLRIGRKTGERIQLLEAHHTLGCSEMFRGDLAAAHAHLARAVELYEPADGATAFQQSGHDPRVCCLANLAVTLWFQGYADQALRGARAAVAHAEALRHSDSLALAHAMAAWVHLLRRESDAARDAADAALAVASDQGLVYWAAMAAILRGAAVARSGDAASGDRQLRRGLSGYETMGAGVARTEYLALCAEASARCGRHAEALAELEQAMTVVRQQGERYLEPELYRIKGELLLLADGGEAHHAAAVEAAEHCFQQSIASARQLQSKMLELRGARSLARLWSDLGKRPAARELLTPLYSWFSEGFDTADLTQAKLLLQELEAPSRSSTPRR